MDNNQNDNSKSKWCPNVFFEKGSISIGEFKTLDDALGFPIPDKWCVNRTVGDNKFEKYMALNVRVLIICDWSKSIQDSRKFVIALVYPDGQTIYFDFNDIQIDANEYETSLDEDVFNAIERVVSAHYKLHNSETNENKQHKTRYNMKKTIRLSESDLHRVIKESVKRVLREGEYDSIGVPTPHPSGDTFRKAQKLLYPYNDLIQTVKQAIEASSIEEYRNRCKELLNDLRIGYDAVSELCSSPGYKNGKDYPSF